MHLRCSGFHFDPIPRERDKYRHIAARNFPEVSIWKQPPSCRFAGNGPLHDPDTVIPFGECHRTAVEFGTN
ncbi:hypothetical protein H351_17275 [Rhodococcus erythropolis R138]|nr:hypothetical protein H351_17275 [Rhodococcus erythropolis R138]